MILFFFPKILQLFTVTYSKWIKVLSMDSTPFIIYPPLKARIFPSAMWCTGKGRMLAAPAESSLQTLMSLNQLSNLILERTWFGESKDSNGNTLDRKNSREYTLNHKILPILHLKCMSNLFLSHNSHSYHLNLVACLFLRPLGIVS